MLGQHENRERVGQCLGTEREAFDRIDREIDAGALAACSDRLADIKERRLIGLSLAHHDRRLDRHGGERAVHGCGGGDVGGDFVAPPAPFGGGDSGSFGDPHDVECERAIDFACRRLRHWRSSLTLGRSYLHARSLGTLRSKFFDADHTRLLVDMAVALDGRERLADGGLGGLMRDHHHGRGRPLVPPVDAWKLLARPALHDALD